MRGTNNFLWRVISAIIIIFNSQPNYAADILGQVNSVINIFDTSNTTSQKTTISSSGPDVSKAKKLVYLTGASYCPDLANWDCQYCKKASSLGYEYSSSVSNTGTNTFGFIVVNKAAKEIVVTFRGTYNVANVLQDVTLAQVSPGGGRSKKSGGGGGGKKKKGKNASSGKKGTLSSTSTIKVHSGFLKATKSLYPQIVKNLGALLKNNKGYSLVITGHSLGAAMASVTLYMLKEKISVPGNFASPSSYAFFGFAEPRVGNQAYADYWNSQRMPVTRIVSKADLVPHIPPASMGFVHHGTEVWITLTNGNKACSKSVYEDNTCSNSLGPVYLATDHVQYWDVTYVLQCAVKDPVSLLSQFVLPVIPSSG